MSRVSPPADPAPAAPRELVLDYLRFLDASGSAWSAAHVRLSGLSPFNRRRPHRRLAAEGLLRLAEAEEGHLFRLPAGDLLCFVAAAAQPALEHELRRLRRLFADDPLLADTAGGASFCRCLTADGGLAPIVAIVEAGYGAPVPGTANPPAAAAPAAARAARGGDMAGDRLARLERALATADLTSFVRRRPVCRVGRPGGASLAIDRLRVASGDLLAALLPDASLAGHPGLDRHVGECVDRRLMALIGGETAAEPLQSLPLSLATVTSAPFQAFNDRMFAAGRARIVIEIDLTDILSNSAIAPLACHRLRRCGYRVLVTGLDRCNWRLIRGDALAADYVDLAFSAAMLADGAARAALAAWIGAIGAGRLILSGVHVREALDFGMAAGIELFQGHYVEHLPRDDAARRGAPATG